MTSICNIFDRIQFMSLVSKSLSSDYGHFVKDKLRNDNGLIFPSDVQYTTNIPIAVARPYLNFPDQ